MGFIGWNPNFSVKENPKSINAVDMGILWINKKIF
jgi:hypothetical protein